MDDQPSLTELLERAGRGDQTSWDTIVERFTNLLWSVARSHRLGSADAGDVVQTTWLRLVENLGRIQDPERLAGWLATTARRESLAVLRRSGRETPFWDGEADRERLADPGVPPETGLLEQERDAELWTCFLKLPERCQRLLRALMAAEPAAYAEVSESLGLPVGSIGPTRMRCLNRLRELTRAADYAFESTAEWMPT